MDWSASWRGLVSPRTRPTTIKANSRRAGRVTVQADDRADEARAILAKCSAYDMSTRPDMADRERARRCRDDARLQEGHVTTRFHWRRGIRSRSRKSNCAAKSIR